MELSEYGLLVGLVLASAAFSACFVVGLLWVAKSTATRKELERAEDMFTKRFEEERAIARMSSGKIHKRLDDVAAGVTRVESSVDASNKSREAWENRIFEILTKQNEQ